MSAGFGWSTPERRNEANKRVHTTIAITSESSRSVSKANLVNRKDAFVQESHLIRRSFLHEPISHATVSVRSMSMVAG
jgi:hypothetical protein